MRAKKLDLTDLRHVLKDNRQWITLAVVVVPEGESSHFELVEDEGQVVDILVDVETVPDGADLTCRLGGGAVAQGIYTVPSVGDEVVVAVPSGSIAFSPTIIALLSSGEVPNPSGQGPAPGRTLVLNGEVLVHDGTGSTDNLVKKSAYEVHKHGSGTGPTTAPDNAALSSSYTDVLKAK